MLFFGLLWLGGFVFGFGVACPRSLAEYRMRASMSRRFLRFRRCETALGEHLIGCGAAESLILEEDGYVCVAQRVLGANFRLSLA